MLEPAETYEQIVTGFKWQIPDRFNIARAVCTRWALETPDRIAIIEHMVDGPVRRTSFSELEEMSNRFANLLVNSGIGRGDRVALLLPQARETAAAHIAIYKIGAIAVPLAMLFGVEAVQYRLQNSGASALIMSTASRDTVSEILPGLDALQVVFCIDGKLDIAPHIHDESGALPATFEAVDTTPDDAALMIYTSGTTGPPKGALHGHRVLLGHIPGIQFAHEFFPQPDDLMWTPSDWAWAGGLLNALLPALYFGVPVLAYKYTKFDPANAWDLMALHNVRNVFIPPTALKLMRASTPTDVDRLTLRTIFSGGEAVGGALQEWAIDSLGMKINEVYGQTECNLVLESCNAIGVWKKGAIGKPVPGHTVAIVDDAGNALPDGEAGNIAVQRPDPVMFLEYWGKPEATRNKYAGDWLLTGDQGFRDAEGYFHFVGRDDDVITSSGYRIGPGEIEDCLSRHPAVKLAAVIGVPDPVRTEIVKAFVVLNDGFEATEAVHAEIQAHVRNRLSAHEYPREIEFRDELPLTTTGKVIRRLLRDGPSSN
ncbi:AMP-binding protein [Anderseniella sp. Alg231-50]|uniref:AMP-binding protein n=1 Tax=Anderseniella sp. Alg231-50 TaxID=1922226 RepID=UPI000D556FDB